MKDSPRLLYGCIEAGGTKFVCGIADSSGKWLEQKRFPTTDPVSTLGQVTRFLAGGQARHGELAAIGIASFGPIELDRASEHWGSLLATPKPGWSGISLVRPLTQAFAVPIALDTDVNAAALAEAQMRANSSIDSLVYITVGTGIGGGAVFRGQAIHGRSHPEMGHLIPPRHPLDADYAGCCPYHGSCVEGLASGPAIVARWGKPLSDLPDGHPAHEIIAWYLGHLASTILAVLSPECIVFGGGVMATPGLMDRVRAQALRVAGDYLISSGGNRTKIEEPRLGSVAGLEGALLLARRAAAAARAISSQMASSDV
ncbi:ROK family protein [Sphingobium sp. JS3065]|uniref:ROK family protein n=1 Tax=Sphingobium sp. JS3065 TaxID=2970925 RepID=UPI0022646A85|nr:ROK family protein [Sphingobium sp. JS3065]UZW54382.1 ROK family protein [Sphingobium sp. JS3065]